MSDDAKLANATATKKLIENMPPRLRNLANSIKSRLEKVNTSFLQTVYEIGEEVAEIQDDTSGKLGNDPIGTLQQAVENNDRGFLLKAARFYRLADQRTLDWLTEARTKIGLRPLTWQHILAALPVDQANAGKLASNKFKEMLKLAISESLTYEELAARVRGELGDGSKKGAGGRPIAIPVGLDKKLANMTAVLGTVVRNHNQIWSHEDHGFLRTIDDMPADKVDESIIDSLDRQSQVIKQAVDVLKAEQKQLEEVRSRAKEKFEEQKRLSQPKALPARGESTEDSEVEDGTEADDDSQEG